MVKNLSTVERSTKIRFGRNCTDDQGENTIVFNASDAQIDASTVGSVYLTPIRQDNEGFKTVLVYDPATKEILNSGVNLLEAADSAAREARRGVTTSNLQVVTDAGNTTTNNVGIANVNPQHLLSVGNAMFVSNTGKYQLQVTGQL